MNSAFNISQNLVGVPRAQTAVKTMRWQLALVLFLLCFSGNPAVSHQNVIDILYSGFAVFLAVLMFYKQRKVVTPDLMIVTGLFGTILLLQSISFSFLPVITIAGFFIRLFIGYAVIRLVGGFPYVYVQAMVGLAVMSLFFHIPYLIGHALAGYDFGAIFQPLENIIGTSTYERKLFFHTFLREDYHRNAGMFWEPGAFAGYLNLAMLFLSMIKEKLSKRIYKCYLIVLSTALFTTLSTAGYIVYPFVLILHYKWKMETKKKTVARIMLGIYIILPVIIGGSFAMYNKLPFLREKIEHQMDVLDRREGRWYRGRISSIVFDWEYIKQRPLTGWGLHSRTRYALHPWLKGSEGMGNGMSDFTSKFGITGMLIWLLGVFHVMLRLKKYNVVESLFIMFILLLILQGEVFLGYPLFIGLMFLCVPRSLPAFSKSHVHRSYYVQT